MAKHSFVLLFFVYLVFASITIISLVCNATENGDENSKVHIVYMGSLPNDASYFPTSHHLNLLQQVMDTGDIEHRLVRSYTRSFNGFAAILTDQQQEKLANMRGVVSVFPSQKYQLLTTRSWDFVGLSQSSKRHSTVETDLVIGVLDSGIWPESQSFNDKGLGPIPKKWKGVCAGGKNFTCNKKLIGARFYGNGDDSARDADGHGSHTASTAGGSEVKDASFYGLAKGIARGGVPSSRIAAYKICNDNGECSGEDLLKAFDDAIADGVDVITVSIGSMKARDFLQDVIAIGAFHAMENGIVTTQSAGNFGPVPSSVISAAPWLVSVAATSIDRQFIDKVVLGDGKTFIGSSINAFSFNGTKFPIAKLNAKACNISEEFPERCDCMDEKLVKGKIVLCGSPGGQGLAYDNVTVGSILIGSSDDFEVPSVTKNPSLNLKAEDYVRVQSYTKSTKNPVAEILKSEILHDKNAPKVVFFSSRGPNPLLLEILKPDISAPGVAILAAYSPLASPSDDPSDKREVNYNIISGTSMSCPHVAGVVAYVKSFHPDWSPAAIKSAIMTTAGSVKGRYDDVVGEYAYGPGNINPNQAIYPGLVYDITKQDYVQLLCDYGYDTDSVKQISGDNSSCHEPSDRSRLKNFNYPAIVVNVTNNSPVKIQRTVTNVGSNNSTYKAILINHNPNIKISVEPKILSFKTLHEKISFVVTVSGEEKSNQTVFSSSLIWSDGTHNVKSPIVVHISQ